MPPNEYFSRLLDDESQGVGHDEGAKSFWHGGNGIKDRGKKHQHSGKDAYGLPYVTQKYTQRRQYPGQTHGEYDQRQQHQGEENRRPVQVAVKERKRAQQYAKTDEAMEKRGTHCNQRQYLNREHHFFNIIDVGENQTGRSVEHLTKQAEHDHPYKQHHGKLRFAVISPHSAPARFKYLREDECIDHKHENRI